MFNSARLKLTAWYLLGIMSISILFSSIIYRGVMSEVYRFERAQRFKFERRLEDEDAKLSPSQTIVFQVPPPPVIPINTDLIEETRERVLIMLIVVNSGILLMSGMIGYVLAGRTLKPIKDMMDEQNRFISDASHEFRTPLTSLRTAFEVFLRNKKSDLKDAKEVISESAIEVNKMQSLSESLLQLAQYEKPNGHSHFSKIQLQQILSEAIHKVLKIADMKQIHIKNATIDLEVEGNEYGLTDLFVILLDNAVKYSPQKSTIKLVAEKKDGSVQVSVVDEGPGIADEDIEHIFDRFYRADSARSKKDEGGYGLGLSIAKKIVDLHKGSIKVEKNKKQGAIFTVKLPISHSNTLQKPTFFS